MADNAEWLAEYAKKFHRLEIPVEHTPKISSELERLVVGIFGIAEGATFTDDPADFLSILYELRDLSYPDRE
jgi:hypothetical protein